MSDRMPEDMSEYMPEDMPDRMPNRMPEDMSDRMPQDLPVRKCINVMVGITRSKVILNLVYSPALGHTHVVGEKINSVYIGYLMYIYIYIYVYIYI